MSRFTTLTVLAGFCVFGMATAAASEPAAPPAPAFDAELAQRLGADDYGMRHYVLVILRTGPSPVPKGEKRDEMFKGHFANIERLASAGKLVLAGPFDGVDGWRGMFIFAVKTIEEAKQLTATDPVIASGEMLAEYHQYYGSAALMQVNEVHHRIMKPD